MAVTTAAGGDARVIALSYGERGESGELWKELGQTLERVKEIRHGEAERAAAVLGAEFRCLDLGDYPLEIDAAALSGLPTRSASSRPDVLLTHTSVDPFNPDHGVAGAAVNARALAAGAGVPSAFATVEPPALLPFRATPAGALRLRPHDLRSTSRAVHEQKLAAMAEMKAQGYLQTYYAERAAHRGNHARRACGRGEIRQAEAFKRVIPEVVAGAVNYGTSSRARLGNRPTRRPAATGLVDPPSCRSSPGSAPPVRRGPCAAARTTT